MTPASPIPNDPATAPVAEPATAPVTDHSADKPVDEWVTGDEPMTGPQRSYLQTLAREAGEDLPDRELNKAEASELIERLQRATGRIPAHRDR
ncbi:MAG: DUF3072 domain-containing protein [Acidimicrobiales bacterium]